MAGGSRGFALAIRKLAGAGTASSWNSIRRVGIESRIQAEECFTCVCRTVTTKATRGKVSAPPTTTPEVKAGPSAKKRLYKGRSLLEVAQFLPGWGVGARMTKTHWRPDTYYQITDIRLNKDGRHGAAWGLYHEEGVSAEKAQKIGGVNKRQWKYLKEEPQRVWKTLRTEASSTLEVKAMT